MTTDLKKTPLHSLHLELGAKMAAFAGYDMPIQYPLGVKGEHLHTRDKAGLFDVSHMGQVVLRGEGVAAALEKLVPVDVQDLGVNQQRYALFTNDQGTILDDLMITNQGDALFLVVNAACKEADIAHLQAHLGDSCELNVIDDHALLAIQGPAAASVMARFAPELEQLVFMTGAWVTLADERCFVTRSGYTGEDGYEISIPAHKAEDFSRQLLALEEVEMIGLGARDSLRLEAGLCLYGHDIDTDTTPIEASLQWAISKARRQDGARAGGFPGADVILQQMADGASKKRVGIQPQTKAPPCFPSQTIQDFRRDGREVWWRGNGRSLCRYRQSYRRREAEWP